MLPPSSVTTLRDMKLRRGDFRIVAVSSMEQIIGTALSTVVGIVIPLLVLLHPAGMTSLMQGIIGSAGLIGISLGSALIGRLIDIQGYLRWFRICPILITLGSLLPFFVHTPGCVIVGMFAAGVGIGGGYTLDSAYISELLPQRWSQFMVGVAKATCALGFTVAAGLGWWIVRTVDKAEVWPWLMLIITGLGLLTFLLRLHWRNSPVWLARQGKMEQAQAAVRFFVGPGVKIMAPQSGKDAKTPGWGAFFHGKNLLKVIYSGVTWACEGLGVYGFGVFLPVLVMALGIESSTARSMHRVIDSVEMTFWINMFIIPGFALGLLIMNRVKHAAMMLFGFVGCVVGLALLAAAYFMHLPVWVSVVAFLIFELCLQGGPHLVTFIIPAEIYSVDERGTGTGIAAMLGKVGAVAGVFFMPMLLDKGGMAAVLYVSMGVMAAGALITLIFGKLLRQL